MTAHTVSPTPTPPSSWAHSDKRQTASTLIGHGGKLGGKQSTKTMELHRPQRRQVFISRGWDTFKPERLPTGQAKHVSREAIH